VNGVPYSVTKNVRVPVTVAAMIELSAGDIGSSMVTGFRLRFFCAQEQGKCEPRGGSVFSSRYSVPQVIGAQSFFTAIPNLCSIFVLIGPMVYRKGELAKR